jgi:chromosome segregation protein
MRIKQLILNGFKSFPEKTVITFDPTINSVVGPNGCGKTNVLDGLRWVMGETSFTQMRCVKTEDLIFAGNTTHPPVNYAEVTLILQNYNEINNLTQPLYNLGTEIEVKRRYYRSGEAEFFINRKQCKLKDIQDLFTSGGGSGHGYSIFDLPTMRQIISSNLKDLFIEAAGLAFYQERKEEIERKFKLTTDDLIRLNDIITERTRITRSLKRQAYRLMAFEKVKGEERKLQIALMRFDYQKISADEKIAVEELIKLQNDANTLEQKITDAEHRRFEVKKVLQEKEDIQSTLQKEINAIKEQLIVNEERLKANLDKQNFLKEELSKFSPTSDFVEALGQSKTSLEDKKNYYNKIKSFQAQKEQAFEDLRRRNKDLEAEIFTDQLALDELAEKDKQLFIRFSQLENEVSSVQSKLTDLKGYEQMLTDSLSALTTAKSERVLDEKYRTMLQGRLGNNFIGFIKELIVTKPDYEIAMESVLYGISDSIVINSVQELTPDNLPDDRNWTIITKLAKTSLKPVKIPKDIGISLSEVVDYKSNLPDYLKSIINSFVLVDNYTQMQSGQTKFPEISFVTKSGVVLTNTGLLIIPKQAVNMTKTGLDEKIQAIDKEIEVYHNRHKELEKSLILLQQEKQEKEKEKVELANLVKQKQEMLSKKRTTNRENLELSSNMLFDLNKRREEVSQLKAELELITSELTRTESRRDTLFSDQTRLTATVTETEKEANILSITVSKLKEQLIERQRAFSETEIGILNKEYDDLETRLNEHRILLDIQKRNTNDKQLTRFEITKNRELLERQASELLTNGLEILKNPETESKNIDDIKKELTSTQRKITAIGLINPLAKDDYEREKAELDKLSNQRNDIVVAQNNLTTALKELTKKAEEMFLETFKAVRISFQRIFQEIFLEGTADLILDTSTNPLESEIRIIAQPKGKVPKRLDQLSDGEKALLALSLLFAFYDIKPAPFVFMDEVDAPLDDANVKRFTKFLQRITQTTQVIIITHNKLTIEAGATVIGVTTEEPGISKIVSVRLKDLPVFATK